MINSIIYKKLRKIKGEICSKNNYQLINSLPAVLLLYPFPVQWDLQSSGWSFLSWDGHSLWAKHWIQEGKHSNWKKKNKNKHSTVSQRLKFFPLDGSNSPDTGKCHADILHKHRAKVERTERGSEGKWKEGNQPRVQESQISSGSRLSNSFVEGCCFSFLTSHTSGSLKFSLYLAEPKTEHSCSSAENIILFCRNTKVPR